jgi:hypothetical protein
LVAALPLVTVVTLVWLYLENQSMEKISNHAWYTFWYVLPTLPMFIAFPLLLPKLGFWHTDQQHPHHNGQLRRLRHTAAPVRH